MKMHKICANSASFAPFLFNEGERMNGWLWHDFREHRSTTLTCFNRGIQAMKSVLFCNLSNKTLIRIEIIKLKNSRPSEINRADLGMY
jgi:hypothetical protein